MSMSVVVIDVASETALEFASVGEADAWALGQGVVPAGERRATSEELETAHLAVAGLPF